MSVDKLVIRFSKALDMGLQEKQLPALNGVEQLDGPWMTLGYFDAMQIYPLPVDCNDPEHNNWLKGIWNHNIKLSEELNGRYYIHPFHIMADLSMDQRRIAYEDFWKENRNCLFITLTQGKVMRPEGATYADILEKCVSEQLSKRDTNVSYVFYRTLELSDLVIIWKADSMTAILERLQELYYQSFIGDLNSFCGVKYSVLEEKAVHKTKESENEGDTGPEIPRVAMRFIVKDVSKPQIVFDELKKYIETEPYFVTGTEDLHVIWTGVKEWDLYRVLHHCFLAEEENKNFRDVYQASFREVETHIGISNERFPEGRVPEPSEPSLLTKKCEKLFDTFSQIVPVARNQDNDCDYSWMKAVRSQLNEMLDMSRSYVVDGLCYLTLDSVDLFCDEAKDLLGKKDPLTSSELEGIQRFVRGWGVLTQQAGRADGRFTQLPGFSPPLYDIPSSLLEFYLAFTKQCGQVLQAGGMDKNSFAMLIVPKLCRRIKVTTVFNFREPPCPRLLYVDIPLDTLYDPFNVLCQLVHEISHFCGEKWRNREERTTIFLSICAYELATALGLETKASIAEIKRDLDLKCKQREYYLVDLEREAEDAILCLIKEDRNFVQWMEVGKKALKFAEPWQEYEWENWCAAHRAIILSNYSQGPLYQMITKCSELFKECYADVSMIRALDLSLSDYLGLAEKELRLYDKYLECNQTEEKVSAASNMEGYHMLVQRFAAVCKAVFNNISQYPLPEKKRLEQFFNDILRCDNYINGEIITEDVLDSPYLNAESLSLLTKYLNQCNSQMLSEFATDKNEKEKLKHLREAFKKIAREHVVGCNSCSSIVSAYETELLNK